MASGSISGTTSNKYIKVKIEWSSVKDEANNRSSFTATMYCRKSSDSSESTYGTGTWNIILDGIIYSFTKRVVAEANNSWVKMGSVSTTISHTENGTKTVSVSASGKITSASTSWTSTSLSGTAVLDNIPRQTAPVFDSDTKEFGQTVHITLTPAQSTFYHSVSYTWNGTTTLINSNVGTSLDFTIPTSYINDIPNAASGNMVFTVVTYRSDGSVVGTSSKTLTCTVPASAAPVISSVVLTDSGTDLPASWGVFVEGRSVLHVKATASGQYGATIVSYTIEALGQTVVGNDVDVGTIDTSGTISANVTVTDSRGLKTTGTGSASVTVYSYDSPTITEFSAVRCNQYGTPVDNGEYARVAINCSISSLNGNNTMQVKIYRKQTDVESYSLARTISPTGTALNATYVIPNISPDHSYNIKVTVEDALSTSSQDGIVAAEGAIISWMDGGIGIAFGKTAEMEHTAEFGWKIYGHEGMELDGAHPLGIASGGTGANNAPDALKNLGALPADGNISLSQIEATDEEATDFVNSIKKAIVDAIYPIGSIFITVNSTSPATLLGGKWQQIKDRFLLADGEKFHAGDMGGSVTQTIEVDGHTHSIRGNSTYYANSASSSHSNYLLTTTTKAGGFSETINIMPPYTTVYVWQRIS